MTHLMDHPLLLFVLSFFIMSLSSWLGSYFSRRRRTLEMEEREGFSIIEAATLTLLGLIIGFSFSMALGRYDQRKNYEEEEANAIGTEFNRADLLPPTEASKLKSLLLKYLDQRVLFYETHDEQQLQPINSATAKLQSELWSAIQSPAVARPDPVVALAVKGMNDVLNSQGYTQAAWWNRIPTAAWMMMWAIAICSNVLVGFGTGSDKARPVLLLVLPLVVSIAFLLIADIDSPRGGLTLLR